jgi:hypothetical protein
MAIQKKLALDHQEFGINIANTNEALADAFNYLTLTSSD